MDQIKRFVGDEAQTLLQHRRYLHCIPEPSYKEKRTMNAIVEALDLLGIPWKKCGPTGIVATIGDANASTVGARFNMDGLEGCVDQTTHQGISMVENCAHACGHDVELAWAISIARYFMQYSPRGAIRLVFQPAEEGPGNDPQGRDGGKLMAEAGAFDGLKALFSFHVDPDLPIGTICVREGVATVGAIDFRYDFTGRSSHLSRPHEGFNPVWEAARTLTQLERWRKALIQSVRIDEYLRIDVSQIGAGLDVRCPFNAEVNTLPSCCRMDGSVRVLGKQLALKVRSRLASLARQANERMQRADAKMSCTLRLTQSAVETVNNPAVVVVAVQAIKHAGFSGVDHLKFWKDAAGWTSERARVCHGYVGCGAEAGKLHTSTFYPPADVLSIGLELFLRCLSA